MISILEYPYFNSFSLVRSMVCRPSFGCCPTMAYLAFGKMPEYPVITPNATTQVIYPSGINKFLASVTVNPIPTTPPTP